MPVDQTSSVDRVTWAPLTANEVAACEVDRLLSAALTVLQRAGWWGFKVANVLREARLSTRTFYRHFENKDDLLAALLHHQMTQAADRTDRSVAREETPWDQVRAYVAAVIDMAYVPRFTAPTALFATHWRMLLQDHAAQIDSGIAQLIRPLEKALAYGAAQGDFPAVRPAEDALSIFHLVASMTADQAAAQLQLPRQELERIVLPYILHSLRGPGDGPSVRSARAR